MTNNNLEVEDSEARRDFDKPTAQESEAEKSEKSLSLVMVPPQETQVIVFAPTWEEARRIGIKLIGAYQQLLEEKGIVAVFGAESGCTTKQLRTKEGLLITLELILGILDEAVSNKLTPEEAMYVRYALDIASSEIYIRGKNGEDFYYISPDSARTLGNSVSEQAKRDGLVTNEEFTIYKLKLFKDHPRFISCEDWADENHMEHWHSAKKIMGEELDMIQMGDDNVVSRADLIRKFTEAGVMNAHLQKPNQSAEELAMIEAVATSYALGNVVIFSHRGTRSEEETYTARCAMGMGAFGGKWTLWGVGRGALIAAMTQMDVLLNKSLFKGVSVPYQGALVLDPNGPYKDYPWAKRVREEIGQVDLPIISTQTVANDDFAHKSLRINPPSQYGPHPSQEGLRELYERIAWVRAVKPRGFEILDIYTFDTQKHGISPKAAIAFGIVLRSGPIMQYTGVMGGISAGAAEPGTHPKIEVAIQFFNEKVRPLLIGLNVASPDEITAKITGIDEYFKARAPDQSKPRFSYIGSEISTGISMITSTALAERLGVPLEVVINYRYNEYCLTHNLATELRPITIPVNYSVVWEGGKHGACKTLSELMKEGIITDISRFPDEYLQVK